MSGNYAGFTPPLARVDAPHSVVDVIGYPEYLHDLPDYGMGHPSDYQRGVWSPDNNLDNTTRGRSVL